jgi:SAM-dependent methyltransferase
VDRNPQAREMADESMVRNLAAQANAIWPQEEPIVRGYRLPEAPAVLDVGCGTGEITARVAALWPRAQVTGVDLVASHLELARRRCAHHADRVTFRVADAFELPFPSASFDLVVCRHMLQAIPTPERVMAELVRVARPGGWLHLLVEDYDMIFASPTRVDLGAFWHHASRAYGRATGCDLHIGRNAYHLLCALPVTEIAVNYAIIDTQRVPRAILAGIFEAWRDGYSETVAHHLGRDLEEVRDTFEQLIACVRDPAGFALWVAPIVSAMRA